MESGGSGVAATQSHHRGRASKHEHGDASHVQQHGTHATGGREGGALLIHDLVIKGGLRRQSHLRITELVNRVRGINLDGLDCGSGVALRSGGFLQVVSTGIKASIGKVPSVADFISTAVSSTFAGR